MASYTVNERAVARARRLIRGRQYVLDSDWGDVQPKADDENAIRIPADALTAALEGTRTGPTGKSAA